MSDYGFDTIPVQSTPLSRAHAVASLTPNTNRERDPNPPALVLTHRQQGRADLKERQMEEKRVHMNNKFGRTSMHKGAKEHRIGGWARSEARYVENAVKSGKMQMLGLTGYSTADSRPPLDHSEDGTAVSIPQGRPEVDLMDIIQPGRETRRAKAWASEPVRRAETIPSLLTINPDDYISDDISAELLAELFPALNEVPEHNEAEEEDDWEQLAAASEFSYDEVSRISVDGLG